MGRGFVDIDGLSPTSSLATFEGLSPGRPHVSKRLAAGRVQAEQAGSEEEFAGSAVNFKHLKIPSGS